MATFDQVYDSCIQEVVNDEAGGCSLTEVLEHHEEHVSERDGECNLYTALKDKGMLYKAR